MHTKTKAWIGILLLTAAIKIFSLFPAAIEKYYSAGLYPLLSTGLRFLFGWLPVSVGDGLYFVAAVYVLVKLVRLIIAVLKKKTGKAYWWNAIRWLVFYSLLVYAVFNIFWGLNYNRLGMAYQLQLEMKPYSTEELQQVMNVIVTRLNSTTDSGLLTRNHYLPSKALFAESYRSYQLAKPVYPQLAYRANSVKQSLYGVLGNYLGYSGYYNPFTGEAQVNTTVPVFMRPFTTCHEMGHQLGYAKENEANFAGFLSAKSSADAAFKYSVYYDVYRYGIRELYGRDSLLAIALNKQKPAQVKLDNLALKDFYDRYENPVEPYIRRLYGQYLKANEQPSGMQSYDEVMAFLIALYKKYGPGVL